MIDSTECEQDLQFAESGMEAMQGNLNADVHRLELSDTRTRPPLKL